MTTTFRAACVLLLATATLQSQPATESGAQSVSVTLLGSGIVMSSPPGMFCSSGTCVQDFVAGSSVKLLANGAPGWTFIGWSGSCTGTEICELVVGSTISVYATFTASGLPAPPPPGESGTSCSSPDPFAAMGGGTCYYGIWMPPGMTIGGPGPEPGCSTPDPFAAMGGGTCYYGIWMPPGMTIGGPGPGPGCSTPDPFAAMGGGICDYGIWMPMPPPGMAIDGSGPEPGPGCSTPDPFASMGGGTCHDGGWLPPGMTMPAGDSPSGSKTDLPGCTTQDPFVGMGGGVCYYGGWLPPGMPLPTAVTPSGSLSPGSPASPLPGATSGASIGSPCATPDPFTAIGGGTCYDGGWLPPGMSPPTGSTGSSTCTTPDPFISLPGLIGVCANGGWVPTIRQ